MDPPCSSAQPTQDDSTGAAYIFSKDGGAWTETAKLKPGSLNKEDFYGRAVALSDDFAFISTVGYQEGLGTTFVFQKSDDAWNDLGNLMAEDGESGDYFGWSVSASGNKVLIGAPAFNREESSGGAYIFGFDEASGTWKQESRLEAELDSRSHFGAAVLLAEGYAIVGAPGVDENAGAVFIYAMNTQTSEWQQIDKLVAFDQSRQARFGTTLGRNDNAIWIGAPYASQFSGSAYIYEYDFERDNWSGVEKLWAKNPQQGARFGNSFFC